MREPRLTALARVQRRSDNLAAARLWLCLRNRLMNGHKFRRELPIPPYIADFACIELKLVIELDGSQHIDNPADAVRNRYMNDLGWLVARFPSADMISAEAGVLETIAAICDGRLTEPTVSHGFSFYPATAANLT